MNLSSLTSRLNPVALLPLLACTPKGTSTLDTAELFYTPTAEQNDLIENPNAAVWIAEANTSLASGTFRLESLSLDSFSSIEETCPNRFIFTENAELFGINPTDGETSSFDDWLIEGSSAGQCLSNSAWILNNQTVSFEASLTYIFGTNEPALFSMDCTGNLNEIVVDSGGQTAQVIGDLSCLLIDEQIFGQGDSVILLFVRNN